MLKMCFEDLECGVVFQMPALEGVIAKVTFFKVAYWSVTAVNCCVGPLLKAMDRHHSLMQCSL